MDINKYIESGILELYVYGALTQAEAEEVSKVLHQYPEVHKEVEEIETALKSLSTHVAPYNPETVLADIKRKLNHTGKVVSIAPKKSYNMPAIIGWAASIALIGGLFYTLNETNNLREDLRYQKTQNVLVNSKYEQAELELTQTKDLLTIVRSNEYIKIPLGAQAVDKDAYASVYWNTKTNTAYIDAQGLPTPPKGKVYQVWSLKLDPLTPTSLGLLTENESQSSQIYKLDNNNTSEAFGITLEPEGGSESPTLEQLYVLGAVGA